MSQNTVLVTGGTGFVGSNVISQLLQKSYKVRAVVRPGKANKIKSIFPSAGSQLETVEVEKLVSDFSDALKGVDYVVHIASPGFFDGETGEEIVEGAYYGALNIVNASIKAGAKKVIVTATYVNLFNPDFQGGFGDAPLTENSWGSIAFEDIRPAEREPMFIYQTAKTAAEWQIWKIAEQHPEVDIITIVPPGIFGPNLPTFPAASSASSLGTNLFLYALLTGEPGSDTYPNNPVGHLVDVRDVAKAHVDALSSVPSPGVNKRLLVSAGTFTWKEAAELIRRRRPELASRLPAIEAKMFPQTSAPTDTSLAAKVIGLKNYIPVEETILDTIDELVAWEKTQKA